VFFLIVYVANTDLTTRGDIIPSFSTRFECDHARLLQ